MEPLENRTVDYRTAKEKQLSFAVLKIFGFFFLLAAISAMGCVGTPPLKPPDPEVRAQHESKIGNALARQLEVQIKLKQEKDILSYLQNLGRLVADSKSELRIPTLAVALVKDQSSVWRNMSLPGNRIYLSIGLIRTLEFENELAAAIALELGHIYKAHLFERIFKRGSNENDRDAPMPTKSPKPPLDVEAYNSIDLNAEFRFFGENGILTFTDEANREGIETAVELLYRAGFDPRGILTIWTRYQANLKHSPHDVPTLAKLVEQTRKSLALFAPLRNPIVRSQAFMMIQKRIQRL